MQLKELKARKIANSRGEETIEVIAETKNGKVFASSPSGRSRGKNEAEPFSFKGIDFSVSFANAIGKKLQFDKTVFNYFQDLEKVEKLIRSYDQSKNWNVVGGNTVFAIESAILKAMALDEKKELWEFLNPKAKSLPLPVGNCIGGGVHIKKDRKPDIQEFLVIPKTNHFYDSYFVSLQAYKEVKQELSKKDEIWRGELTDENAMAASLKTEEILDLLKEVSFRINEKMDVKLDLGMDVAASTLWNKDHYNYKNPKNSRDKETQVEYILALIKKYNLFYVEDPLHENDFEGFAEINEIAGKNCLIVGDDLICTQIDRLKEAIDKKSINAVIVKPNQNGSLLQTKELVDLAQKHKIIPIISHRSGETLDSTIADLAVSWKIKFIKTGILGKERFAKLNRLLKIERQIKD